MAPEQKERIKSIERSTQNQSTNHWDFHFSLFVTCLPGLEPLLLKEIEYLHSSWQDNNHSTNSDELIHSPFISWHG
jgi:hypothetical protein